MSIRIKIPKAGTKAADRLDTIGEEFRSAQVSQHQAAYDSYRLLRECDQTIG